ncbi:EmrA/EmrK family multidrug efflux transporter periplasmic adaptor subunit [soil metagenome]
MTDAAVTTRPGWRRPWLFLVFGLIAVGSLYWSLDWFRYRFTHSISKDAFVDTHLINLSPQVEGSIVEVFVQEQDRVKKGQVLARIDPSIYLRDVQVAEAKLATTQATLQKAEADLALLRGEIPQRITIAELRLAIAKEDETKAVESLEMVRADTDSGVSAARRAIDGTRAKLVLAGQDFERYQGLYKDRSVSERRLQEATQVHETAKADVQIAEAKLAQAEANRKQAGIAAQQLQAARHAVREANASVALAKLGNLQITAVLRVVDERTRQVTEARRSLELAQVNLGYTKVLAPFDAVIAKKWRHLGDYAHKGDPIYSMYNPELLYVTVHLEESLLQGVQPGNWADLQFDAFDQPLRGRVVWIGSATGANFSLIPRDISSGEFTYVVQRVPTRIVIERDARWELLKPGLSVRASIEHGTGDPKWAAEANQRLARLESVEVLKP